MKTPSIPNLFEQIDSNINSYFYLDSREYEIEKFQIVFGQAIDNKGQPQHEVKGGQFVITLSQAVDDNIYDWAKRSDRRKTGSIRFKSESRGTLLEINFIDANCISLVQKINAFSGAEVMMVITSKMLVMNGVQHDNRWRGE